eukprot:Plantae.Rhodophyta-Hildenbrandia_rubra.ctg12034.p1 GENE.Plantae.Rhodophyta-Hildenbrandia_rubra.ctg12034~~Plantae.Rhodophyta-Hildenbrandia_rubra.ctg12034.p1  ORF type:complete len:367 (+),score=32.71 Plantae.Rhodophyta-Hildenbrandia_rubra.ctg12034:239-1339(+)
MASAFSPPPASSALCIPRDTLTACVVSPVGLIPRRVPGRSRLPPSRSGGCDIHIIETSHYGGFGRLRMGRKSPRRKRRSRPSETESAEEASGARPSSEEGEAPHARNFAGDRVNNKHTTMSVRQQIAYGRYRQATSSESEKPTAQVPRTKFRKKKTLQEIRINSKHTREEKSPDLPAGKYSFGPRPIVYVDGYNVINKWAKLRKRFVRGDLFSAREFLVDQISEFVAIRSWDCVIVFDAQGGSELESREKICDGLEVVYTGSSSADSYIERQTYEMCKVGKRQVWAATSDFAQQQITLGQGAHVMSAARFIKEVMGARQEIREKIKSLQHGSIQQRSIIQALDDKTRDQLYALRDELGWRVQQDNR